MSTTLPTNMIYRDPFAQSGYIETLTQAIDKFNAGSANTINLKSQAKMGDFDYSAFFKKAGNTVSRQDLSSTAAVASMILTQDQIVSVKLNRKVGPFEITRSAFLKPGFNPDLLSYEFGKTAAVDALADMLNTGISAGATALSQHADVSVDASTGTISASTLVDGMAKFGDQAQRIQAFVMHSKVFFDLMKNQVNPASAPFTIAGAVMQGATPASFNRPIIVTDSAALFDGTHYLTLGLTQDAIVVEETEEMYNLRLPISGQEQIIFREQAEYAYNLGVKGFAWDVANGGKNPADAAIAAAANWDRKFTSNKDLAGVVIKTL